MKVLRGEGIRGLYRGLTASYLGVSESTLQWVLYEKMKGYLARREECRVASGRNITSWDTFVDWGGKLGAAGSAKLFAAMLTYPHEVVRTRLRQRPMEGGKLKYTGLFQCFRAIWREEGLVSMYGGLSPHLVGSTHHSEDIRILFAEFIFVRTAPSCSVRGNHVWYVRGDSAGFWHPIVNLIQTRKLDTPTFFCGPSSFPFNNVAP